MSKATLIETDKIKGAYDIDCTIAIVEHPDHGRLLVQEGFGGDGVEGETYRWRHGIAAKIKNDDTIQSLRDGEWNNYTSTLEAVCAGQDASRPLLEWPGHIIDTMMTSTLRSAAAAAMGRARTPAKTAAVRENGKKGGRPKKQ